MHRRTIKQIYTRKTILKSYTTTTEGTGFQKRIYLLNDKKEKISFWNDVVLQPDGYAADVFQAGIEIPMYSLAKMEVAIDEPYHPIKQDTRTNQLTNNTELRYYAQFPDFHYGFLPQTWENPLQEADEKIKGLYGLEGDDDPLDIVELGCKEYKTGGIEQVEVLGSLCLVDQGQIDWKVFVLNVEEANNRQVHCLEDVHLHWPGRLTAIMRWFTRVKTFHGKPPNVIYQDTLFNKHSTLQVIHHNHQQWLKHKS